MSVTMDEISAQQWAQIIAILKAETNVGPTGPGSGSNPSGRLQNVYDVRQSIDPWTGLFPWVGVQLAEVSESDYASRQHQVISTFHIVIGTKSNAKTAAANGYPQPNLDDAMAQLQALRADGNGNGVTAILRDTVNYNLASSAHPNGLAAKTWISKIAYDWKITPGDDTEALAWCVITYNAKGYVSI